MARTGAYAVFERELETVRRRYGMVDAGYVPMPEHVHLLVGEPGKSSLAIALQVLKQQTWRELKRRGAVQLWQRQYYDFNVHNELKRVEKLRYMHRNPVKRGLVEKPEEWSWSSFRHYATGVEGVVKIESDWTARRREVRQRRAQEQLRIPPLYVAFRGVTMLRFGGEAVPTLGQRELSLIARSAAVPLLLRRGESKAF